MFGRHKAKREKKRSQRRESALQEEINNLKTAPKDPVDEIREQQQHTDKIAADQKERDRIAREEGKLRADEILSREYKGLGDNQRRNLQESSNAQINRDIQGYEKKLLAQQGARGLKGGTAFAQKQDLARMGVDAQQQTQRDLSALDSDLALKKLAAAYNIEQGSVGEEALRRQMAQDSMDAYDNKKYQKWLADQANKLFQRI